MSGSRSKAIRRQAKELALVHKRELEAKGYKTQAQQEHLVAQMLKKKYNKGEL